MNILQEVCLCKLTELFVATSFANIQEQEWEQFRQKHGVYVL